MIDERADELWFGGPFFDGLGEVLIHFLCGERGDEEENGAEDEAHRIKITFLRVRRAMRGGWKAAWLPRMAALRKNGGAAGGYVGGLFERVGELEDAPVVVVAADDLQADGKAGA